MKHLRKRLLCIAVVFSLIFTDSAIAVLAENIEKTQEQSRQIRQEEDEEEYIVEELADLRTAYSKTYEKSDGSKVSVIYAQPIHFYNDKEKTWEEYDNTLIESKDENDNSVLINKNSELSIQMPKILGDDTSINLSYEDYSISILPISVSNTEANEANNDTIKSKSIKDKTVNDYVEETIKSEQVEYKNAFKDTTIEYEVNSNSLKETLKLLKKPEKDTTYEFELNFKGLKPQLNDDGSVELKNDDATVFIIPAPFMIDKNNAFSDDIKTELTEIDGKYVISYTPNMEWLSEETREYPVSIDPTINLAGRDAIDDAFVYSEQPNVNYGTRANLNIGKIHSGSAIQNEYEEEYLSFIKFNDLPENIWNNSYITNANLSIYAAYDYGMTINMHEVTSDWNESEITYNNMPEYDQDVIVEYKDFTVENPNNSSAYFNWDVTNLLEKWYNDPEQNYGVMLETSNINYYPAMMFSSDYSSFNHACIPYLTIEYSSMDNAAYANSRDVDIGRAGIVNINDFNGNLRLTRNDLGVDGNIMPVNISMVYDQNNVNLSTDLVLEAYGKGFRTNYSQRIVYDSDNDIYTYIDADSRPIYFEKT